jgi:anthranilate synthase component 1
MTDDDALRRLAGARGSGTLVPLRSERVADLETPVSAFLKLRDRGAQVLLESVESGVTLGRYSFLGLSSGERLEIGRAAITSSGNGGARSYPHDGEPLGVLRDLLDTPRVIPGSGDPPFLGGAVGYLAYDLVRYFEPLSPPPEEVTFPLGLFHLVRDLVVFDHVRRTMTLVALADPDAGDPSSEVDRARARLRAMEEGLARPVPIPETGEGEGGDGLEVGMEDKRFLDAVVRIQEAIAAGEVYQTVLSRRVSGVTRVHPFQVYRALRVLNPSPYLYYLDFGDHQVVGSSPEVLVKVSDGHVELRPIAGTRPRGEGEAEDRSLERELLGDEKERAEHVMLVDLGRNDLGRVCRSGSVSVEGFMDVERYSHVMHIVSTVTGELQRDRDRFDLLRTAVRLAEEGLP